MDAGRERRRRAACAAAAARHGVSAGLRCFAAPAAPQPRRPPAWRALGQGRGAPPAAAFAMTLEVSSGRAGARALGWHARCVCVCACAAATTPASCGTAPSAASASPRRPSARRPAPTSQRYALRGAGGWDALRAGEGGRRHLPHKGVPLVLFLGGGVVRARAEAPANLTKERLLAVVGAALVGGGRACPGAGGRACSLGVTPQAGRSWIHTLLRAYRQQNAATPLSPVRRPPMARLWFRAATNQLSVARVSRVWVRRRCWSVWAPGAWWWATRRSWAAPTASWTGACGAWTWACRRACSTGLCRCAPAWAHHMGWGFARRWRGQRGHRGWGWTADERERKREHRRRAGLWWEQTFVRRTSHSLSGPAFLRAAPEALTEAPGAGGWRSVAPCLRCWRSTSRRGRARRWCASCRASWQARQRPGGTA